MITIYYNLVKAGRREFEQVPEEFQKQVQALLDKDKAEGK